MASSLSAARAVRGVVAGLCVVACLAGRPAFGQSARADAQSVALPEEDAAAIGKLFGTLAGAFKVGDAEACAALLAPSRERDKIKKALLREFQQVRYLDFQILKILPDDTRPDRTQSVDVQLACKLVDLDMPTPVAPLAPLTPHAAGAEVDAPEQAIENTTTQTFVLEKQGDGRFAIVSSDFFMSLGLRQGLGLVVKGSIAVMALVALLAFWVWMGSAAWWRRPRETFWRVFVLVPLVGALAFFFISYLPRELAMRRNAQ